MIDIVSLASRGGNEDTRYGLLYATAILPCNVQATPQFPAKHSIAGASLFTADRLVQKKKRQKRGGGKGLLSVVLSGGKSAWYRERHEMRQACKIPRAELLTRG